MTAREEAERIADGIMCDLPIEGPVRNLLLVRIDVALHAAIVTARAEAVEEAVGHLGAALVQLSDSDDQIIAGHIRDAHDLLVKARRVT